MKIIGIDIEKKSHFFCIIDKKTGNPLSHKLNSLTIKKDSTFYFKSLILVSIYKNYKSIFTFQRAPIAN